MPYLKQLKVNTTRFTTKLPCGNIYRASVKAVTARGGGAQSQVSFKVKSTIGGVTNLQSKFLNKNATGFELSWGPPRNLNASEIKVRVLPK